MNDNKAYPLRPISDMTEQSQGGRPWSVQDKLVLLYATTSLLVIVVNMVLFVNINGITEELNSAYETNVLINELSDSLERVQSSMTEYLNTKSTDSIESYYAYEQEYRDDLQTVMVKSMESVGLSEATAIVLENIDNLSSTYLEITTDTVQAKRGRVVEKYNVSYEEAEELYGYINAYIYSLNNEQFRHNSRNYETLHGSLRYLEFVTILILLSVAVINIVLTTVITKNIMDPVKERELMMASHLKDAELKYLQAQINPHFLFNTLNNISSLTQIDADAAQDAIAQLSDLLRYAMYETNKPQVAIQGEVEFMRNYISLMELRCNDKTEVNAQFSIPNPQQEIAPLIFISLIENAFKHGVSSNRHSRIDITLQQEDDTLVFTCDNTNYPKDDADRSGSGIGIENTRRRLDLMYANRYTWEQSLENDIYHVRVTLKIKG